MRLIFGRLADRPTLRWALAITGYDPTAPSVPLSGITNALWIAYTLVLAERLGKAVRGPAKDTMLAEAGTGTAPYRLALTRLRHEPTHHAEP